MQAEVYCIYMGVKLKPVKDNEKYMFVNDEHLLLRLVLIRIPILNQHIISKNVDVEIADIPFFVGLDFLDKYKMYVDNKSNNLCTTPMDFKISFTRRKGDKIS